MNKLTSGLKRLVDAIENETSQITVSKAAELMEKAAITQDDLLPWADFEHPAEDGYGRKMVFKNEKFEVMVMTWNPGDYSSVHDHGYTQWGAVQVFGNVLHQTFSNIGSSFRLAKKEILQSESITKVNNALIHQMGNATTRAYLTLHMYGANEPHKTVTANMKIYELETGKIRLTQGGAFFNLDENEAPVINSMHPIEKETFVNHAAILMQYYCRYPANKIYKRRRALLKKLEELVCDHVPE